MVERNPKFSGTTPKLERIRFRIVPDAIVRALELRKGSGDIEISSLTPDIMALFRNTPEEPNPKEFNLHRYLATCLGYLRDPAACDLLLEAIGKYKNPETRAAALDALGTIKEPRTLPALVKLLDDSEGLVRKYAAFNVGAVA